MTDALKRLLNAFDAIGADHGEIEDTEVREQTRELIQTAFVHAVPTPELPTTYGMFSDDGNAAVRGALAAFLAEPAVQALIADGTPEQRHEAFQNIAVLSDEGMTYDEYFGYMETL